MLKCGFKTYSDGSSHKETEKLGGEEVKIKTDLYPARSTYFNMITTSSILFCCTLSNKIERWFS
jgi:hypothetical protein